MNSPGSTGHPARGYFQERYETLRREVSEALSSRCAERGVAAGERVDSASAAILAVMDGLQLQWLLHPEVVHLSDATELAIRAIVNDVLSPGPDLGTYATGR